MKFTEDNTVFHSGQWYAVFAGWLIVPTVVAMLDLIGAVIMVAFVQTGNLVDNEILIYYGDVVRLPLLIIAFIWLFQRKRLFTQLMIIYFSLSALFTVYLYMNDFPFDTLRLIMSIGLVIYFILSKRVKATFTE